MGDGRKALIGLVVGAGIAGIIYLATREARARPPMPPIPIPGLANIYGMVTDAGTGQPIDDAVVKLLIGVMPTVTESGIQTTTDVNGHYTILGVSFQGMRSIAVEKEGYARVVRSIILVEGNNEENVAVNPMVWPPFGTDDYSLRRIAWAMHTNLQMPPRDYIIGIVSIRLLHAPCPPSWGDVREKIYYGYATAEEISAYKNAVADYITYEELDQFIDDLLEEEE